MSCWALRITPISGGDSLSVSRIMLFNIAALVCPGCDFNSDASDWSPGIKKILASTAVRSDDSALLTIELVKSKQCELTSGLEQCLCRSNGQVSGSCWWMCSANMVCKTCRALRPLLRADCQ